MRELRLLLEAYCEKEDYRRNHTLLTLIVFSLTSLLTLNTATEYHVENKVIHMLLSWITFFSTHDFSSLQL